MSLAVAQITQQTLQEERHEPLRASLWLRSLSRRYRKEDTSRYELRCGSDHSADGTGRKTRAVTSFAVAQITQQTLQEGSQLPPSVSL